MNFLKRLFQKASEAKPIVAINHLGRPAPMEHTYRAFSEEGYKKNVIAFRCINLIANSIAELKWLLYEKSATAQRSEVDNHPILELLLRPNPMQGKEAYFQEMASFFLLDGNSYLESVGPNDNAPPLELWNLRPDRMSVVPGITGMPAAFVFKENNRQKVFEVDQVTGKSKILQLKTFNPLNDYYGLSPIAVAALEIDQLNEGNIWNLSLLKNSARPSGALIYKPEQGRSSELSKNQRDSLKQELMESYAGSANVGRPMLLEGGLTYQQMGFNPLDMDWLNSKNVSEKDVALAFGVPGQLVGVKDSQTFANYAQAKEALYLQTVLPLGNIIKGELNNWLVPKFDEGLELDIDLDSIEALALVRQRKWENVKDASFLTLNEKREATGFGKYEPTDDPADQLLVNAGLIPLELATSSFDSDPLTDVSDVGKSLNNVTLFNSSIIEASKVSHDVKSGSASMDGTDPLLSKQLNIRNEKRKRQILSQIIRKRQQFERVLGVQFAALFKKEGKAIAESIDASDPTLAEFIIDTILDQQKPAMEKLLETNIRRVMESFGGDIFDMAKSYKGPIEIKQEASQTRFENFINLFLKRHVAQKITYVQAVTKKKVMVAVKDALLQENANEVVLSKEITKVYSGFGEARARTIARTEVHNASNVASREAAKSLQVPQMQKEWVSDLSDTARGRGKNDSTNHVRMNGKRVAIDEKFEVPSKDGIDLMEGPGDPEAPADQIINCKCTTVYVLPEEQE